MKFLDKLLEFLPTHNRRQNFSCWTVIAEFVQNWMKSQQGSRNESSETLYHTVWNNYRSFVWVCCFHRQNSPSLYYVIDLTVYKFKSMHFLYEYFKDDDVSGNWHFTAYEDILTLRVTVKQSLYRPGQALRCSKRLRIPDFRKIGT